MDRRDTLLRKISAHEFAAWEIQIFLDTHPTNKTALNQKSAHEKKAKELREMFEKEYGCLLYTSSGRNRAFRATVVPELSFFQAAA